MEPNETLELDPKEQILFEKYKKTDRPSNKKHIFILVGDDGKLIVSLAEDGELKLGENVDEAAKEFWNYVKMYRPAHDQPSSVELMNVKAHCYDLMQENKALKNKIATLIS